MPPSRVVATLDAIKDVGTGFVAGGERSLLVEVAADGGMDGGKHLQTSHPPEPLHGPFASAERQVGVFSVVVGPTARFPIVATAEALQGRPIGAKAICHKSLGPTMSLQRFPKGFQGSLAVSGPGCEALQHLGKS